MLSLARYSFFYKIMKEIKQFMSQELQSAVDVTGKLTKFKSRPRRPSVFYSLQLISFSSPLNYYN